MVILKQKRKGEVEEEERTGKEGRKEGREGVKEGQVRYRGVRGSRQRPTGQKYLFPSNPTIAPWSCAKKG